ncbi:hypothetical protein T265_00858 [Opisthorchis viverrini]|uniref:Uncharacterized protein n=1 Tax=Opisthorchis viverrini TaxID=6198 RepID=A0A075AJC7_OPIVI|nr:hypothetical protein T265_00858 [Opisthorchis viverrini]KER33154.1 hypothetical protein T265_00858 [Opisthorchis viverrini]
MPYNARALEPPVQAETADVKSIRRYHECLRVQSVDLDLAFKRLECSRLELPDSLKNANFAADVGWDKELCEADGLLTCRVHNPTSATYEVSVTNIPVGPRDSRSSAYDKDASPHNEVIIIRRQYHRQKLDLKEQCA